MLPLLLMLTLTILSKRAPGLPATGWLPQTTYAGIPAPLKQFIPITPLQADNIFLKSDPSRCPGLQAKVRIAEGPMVVQSKVAIAVMCPACSSVFLCTNKRWCLAALNHATRHRPRAQPTASNLQTGYGLSIIAGRNTCCADCKDPHLPLTTSHATPCSSVALGTPMCWM